MDEHQSIMSLKRRLVALPYLGVVDKTNWLSKWRATVRSAKCQMFPKREDMYRYLQSYAIKSEPIDYVEFGVADGASLRYWCKINQELKSRFFGFDSFAGLPEHWHKNKPKGSFNRNGKPPEIGDQRATFQIGWFQDTLPRFVESFSPRNRIVLHNDSDLYSSTLYTLTMMDRFFRDGTIVIFDEFWDAQNEYRAWCDYSSSYRKGSVILAATKNFSQVAIMLSSAPPSRADALRVE